MRQRQLCRTIDIGDVIFDELLDRIRGQPKKVLARLVATQIWLAKPFRGETIFSALSAPAGPRKMGVGLAQSMLARLPPHSSRLIQNFPDFWKMEGTPSTPSGGPLGAKTLQINVGEAGVFTNIAWTIRNSLART